MTLLRAGTRGSDLALWQTRWVCDLLRAAHPFLTIDEVIIKTHGDVAKEQALDTHWPVGGFVDAIERALVEKRIDFGVHSYKDLPTAATSGLVIAAVPVREVVHDVLVSARDVDLYDLPPGFCLGTSSPRRAAQFRRLGDVQIVPIRGNVPTRIAKIERGQVDGVVLAAAGLKRLGIDPPHRIDLPTDRFVPAPAQGALALQARRDDDTAKVIASLEDAPSRLAVETERSFLRAVNAGCDTPVGALATLDGRTVSLHAQLFSDDGERLVEGVEVGEAPALDPIRQGQGLQSVGIRLAKRLLRELEEGP